MAKPGPAPRPALQVVREGNPGHHGAARLDGGLRLKPAAPPEPRWLDWFPAVRVPTDKQLRERHPVEEIEGQFAHIEDDEKRVYLAAARQRWLVRVDRDAARRARAVNTRARKVASGMWREVVAILDSEGLLALLDRGVLTDMCRTWARMDECERDISERGMWVMGERGAMKNPSTTVLNQLRQHFKFLVGELGMTPVARDRLSPKEGGGDGDSPFD